MDEPFSSGADLWILPERKNSTWTQGLDWYLNFQIAKALQHESRPVPSTIHEILQACELKGYDFVPDERDALLIHSRPHLPNRWVMVLRGSEEADSWLRLALEKWKKMNRPSLRIFLPAGARRAEMVKLWKKLGGDETVSFFEEAADGK